MAVDDQPEFLKPGSRIREAPRKPDAQPQAPAPAPAEPPQTSSQWMHERTRVAVGHGTNISGKLIFNEPVRIEGFFRGEVNSSHLVVIDEQGMVEGRVKAGRLAVLGELRGDIIECSRVYLGPHARVWGDIKADNLTISEGAYFSGNVRMPGFHSDKQRTA
jgi:cytoskeletal protein CcmA (bactofilin family)